MGKPGTRARAEREIFRCAGAVAGLMAGALLGLGVGDQRAVVALGVAGMVVAWAAGAEWE